MSPDSIGSIKGQILYLPMAVTDINETQIAVTFVQAYVCVVSSKNCRYICHNAVDINARIPPTVEISMLT
jgi:hypothetical protein